MSEMIAHMRAHSVVNKSFVLSLAGKLAFAAGAVPQIRPFINPLWSVAAGTNTSRLECRKLVHTKRERPALNCLLAFFSRVPGSLRRTTSSRQHCGPRVLITVDASPWGMAGISVDPDTFMPLEWWADDISEEDQRALGALMKNPPSGPKQPDFSNFTRW
eukprot:1910633-Amphidinium_carterae.2